MAIRFHNAIGRDRQNALCLAVHPLDNAMPTSTDRLISAAESLDSQAHHVRPVRGRWMLPLLRAMTTGTVLVARRLELVNG